MHCIHVTDPATEDRADKLGKVRPFLSTLQQNFPWLFAPGVALSIDEAMIKYNGRLRWKQYMPMKPIKWGIKLWVLCDARTGYCLALYVYTGHDDHLAEGMGLTYNIVIKLSSSYLLRNHHLYADNFYSSLGLIRDLHDADTYFCGTIRKNSRGLPKQISDMALQRGQSEKLSADCDIVFCRWYDRRDVFVVAKNTTGRDIVKPRTRFTPNDMITVPEIIVDYNWNIGGVDHLDQFRGYYVGRAGRKWWKYVLFGLFNFAMKCLANRPLPSNQREWSLLTFRMAVMHQMCDNLSSRIDP